MFDCIAVEQAELTRTNSTAKRAWVLLRIVWAPPFVCAPTEFSRLLDALVNEALDRPVGRKDAMKNIIKMMDEEE